MTVHKFENVARLVVNGGWSTLELALVVPGCAPGKTAEERVLFTYQDTDREEREPAEQFSLTKQEAQTLSDQLALMLNAPDTPEDLAADRFVESLLSPEDSELAAALDSHAVRGVGDPGCEECDVELPESEALGGPNQYLCPDCYREEAKRQGVRS